MFIRTKKDTNKKTGTIYERQVLTESVWKDGRSYPRTVMDLGHLELPKSDWDKLAHALECQFTGQECLLSDVDQDIWRMAQRLYSGKQLTKSVRKKAETNSSESPEYTPIDLSSLETEKSRTIGTELVCDWAWNQLDMDEILSQCGLSRKEITVARALIFGRMIAPDSERQTYEWFQNRSSLSEFPGSDISQLGKDLFYTVGDELCNNKDRIEKLLYEKERVLYPHNESTIYLFDLTNTYMEGSCLYNELAQRGHCKSKRYDLPLITLSFMVDGDGMPIRSMIYPGNQSEPETFPSMMARIEKNLWNGQQTLIKPTIAMDRGIATKEVVNWLSENHYPYVVIRREDSSEEYRDIFVQERDTFVDAGKTHISSYGDECSVYVRKMEEHDGVVEVLCISDGKAHKQEAIDQRRRDAFLEDIHNLEKSIQKGSIKKTSTIRQRLDNKISRHKTLAENYTIDLICDERGIPTGIRIEEKKDIVERLFGCYVMETTHVNMDAVDIWNMYMTLTMVESAFRMLKGPLGIRPVYHQRSKRCEAHLFISVLAYHLLMMIRRKLLEANDHRYWDTIRETLSTHMRSTIVAHGKENSYHIRVTGKPETQHLEIYGKLDVRTRLPKVITTIQRTRAEKSN